MKSYITKLIMFIATLFFVSSTFAEEKFCDTYDPAITNMNAIDGKDAAYSGLPKVLSAPR